MSSFLCRLSVLIALGLSGPALAQSAVELDRSPHAEQIGDRQVSFMARDLETGTTYMLEGSAVDERRTPWSTFKIPNLIIALETGATESLETDLPWNPGHRPAADFWPQDWRQDQTLHTAFQRSVAWAFRDLAVEIGTDVYRETLSNWGYGDVDVAEGSDQFWLDHTLEISLREQIDFLDRLLSRQLGVSETSLHALDEVSLAGDRPDGALHGKTGAGPVELSDMNGRFEGWYVGYLVREDRAPIVFALHAEAASYAGIRTFRRDMAERLLSDVTAGID